VLDRRQQGVYRPLVAQAWQVFCRRNAGTVSDKVAKDAWYRKELVNELGVYTTKQIGSPEEFDSLMLHFATIADNEYWIDRASRGAEGRALWLLKKTMGNAGVDWPYVYGIARNMGYDKVVEELPAEAVLKINTAVYIYMKRQQKKEAQCTRSDSEKTKQSQSQMELGTLF